MKLWDNLRLRFLSPRIADPDFGKLTFMFISNYPEKSYWEGEWAFPGLANKVAISLGGTESGPMTQFRDFYLSLPGQLDRIIGLVRPRLAEVFEQRLNLPLPEDMFSVLKLSVFGVEDPAAKPLKWNIGFETTGDTWLGIMIPLIDDVAQKATVDT